MYINIPFFIYFTNCCCCVVKMRSISIIFNVVLFLHVCNCATEERSVDKEHGWSSLKKPISHIAGLLGTTLSGKYDDHCDDVFQSPINLPADSKIASYGNIKFTGFQFSRKTKLVVNNGISEYYISDSREIQISEGGLKGTYYFHKSKYFTPSVHTVAGARYVGEIQLIFINIEYPDYETASLYPDGLAVLVIFVMIGTKENLAFTQYADGLKHLTGDPPSYEYPLKFSLASGLPVNRCSFFRYRGKLSHHSCKEIATWTIFTEPLQITEKQYMETSNILRSIFNKYNSDFENVHTKLRGIDLDDLKYNRKRIVTLQPTIFCKNHFESKEVLPWFFFHTKF